jgi:hypothetical protein
MYWLFPERAPAPFRAYIDFTTPNGPWVHVGTAAGNTRGLWTYADTWRVRGQDTGDLTTPHAASASFNSGSFIYCKGSQIMIKHNQDGYAQATGFYNESWRDVYYFLNGRNGWSPYNTHERELTITRRSGVITSTSTTAGSGLLSGTEYSAANAGNTHWYVFAEDAGGDTFAFLTTSTYGGNLGYLTEADIGIGAQENGPAEQAFPGDTQATNASTAYDAGSNGSDSGAATSYDGRAFSMWIKN